MTLECNHPSFREFEKRELAKKVGEVIECELCGDRYKVEEDPFEAKFYLVQPSDSDTLCEGGDDA